MELLLKEVGLDTSQQQTQQEQLLLLVQHADEVLSRHAETEAPGLLLALFLLARADPAVLQVRAFRLVHLACSRASVITLSDRRLAAPSGQGSWFANLSDLAVDFCIQMMHASPSLLSLRPALRGETAEKR